MPYCQFSKEFFEMARLAEMTKTITVRLDPGLYERMEASRKVAGEGQGMFVRRAIRVRCGVPGVPTGPVDAD